MKRREILITIPFSIAGTIFWGKNSFSLEKYNNHFVPIDSGSHAIQYINKVKEMLNWIRETQSENILEASHAIARTVKNGGQCWCFWDMGHSALADVFPGRNGEPEIFIQRYDKNRAKKGDLFLTNLGEYPPFDDIVKKIFCDWRSLCLGW